MLAFALFVFVLAVLSAPLRAYAAPVEVSTWDELEQAIESASGDTLELSVTQSVTADSAISFPTGADVIISFADEATISCSGGNSLFTISAGASFTIAGPVTVRNIQGSFARVDAGGSFAINGAITAENASGNASFIDIAGTLSMNEGGAVKGWKTSSSSGDYSAISVHGAGATFTMSGGEVSGNIVTRGANSVEGGAIQLRGGAKLIMNAGSISGNNVYATPSQTVVLGGGIYANASTIEMAGGTISGNMAYHGGGVYLTAGSSMTVTGGAIDGNSYANSAKFTPAGGGIYAESGCSLTVESADAENPVSISNNTTADTGSYIQARGGGIFADDATVVLTDALVDGNNAAVGSGVAGGGIYLDGDSGSLTVTDSTISNNSGYPSADNLKYESGGGGIVVDGKATATITDSTISGNTALYGAGMYFDSSVSVSISGCTVSGNRTMWDESNTNWYYNSAAAGGIFFNSSKGTLTVSNTDFSENVGIEFGGSVALVSGTADLDDCEFTDNSSAQGGAFFMRGGTATVDNSTFTGNEGTGAGGALSISGGTATFTSCTLSQNTSNGEEGWGGAAYVAGTLTLNDCDVTENEATNKGSAGGLFVDADGALTLTESAIDKNEATTAGGVWNNGGAITMESGSISGNTADEAGGVANVAGTFDMNGGSIANNVASGMAGGVENGGTFTMSGGDITGNKANGATDGIGGGVANLGTFTMEGGRIFSNTAAHGANDFYNYSELEDEGGQEGGVVVDPGWDGDHNMGLDSLSYDDASARAGEQYGTFTLIDPSGFNLGVDGWYEDEPNARYADADPEDRVAYKIVENDTSEQYLTLGDPVAAGVLTLEPQDMVAYTGGDSMDGDNFPEVRYRVSADDDLLAALGGSENIDDITVMVDGQPIALSAEDSLVGELTVIIPELGTTFTLEDDASTDDEVAGVYDIAITGTVTAELSDGRAVDVRVATDDGAPATLTVRTVSNASDAASEEGQAGVVAASPVTVGSTATGVQDASIATATVDEGARFYTNGDTDMGLLGTDAADPESGALISLLFDDLLPSADGTTADTVDALAARAGIDADNAEFKYLDLVNEHDGNAWVSTDSDVTISWPVPAGVDVDEVEFTVYHFEGLHREYGGAGSPDAAEQIEKCTVEQIPCKVVDNRVVFTLKGDAENGCFSPFALTWTATDQPAQPEQPGGDTPGGQQSGQQPGGGQQNGGQQVGGQAASRPNGGVLASTGDSTPMIVGAVVAAGAVVLAAGIMLCKRSARK